MSGELAVASTAITGIVCCTVILLAMFPPNHDLIRDILPCEMEVENFSFENVDENSPLYVLKDTTGGNFHITFPCGRLG